jgi:TolA-binding protein
MSSETRSPADTAFERRLFESARGDAPPREVEQAWARFAGSLGAVLADPGGAAGRAPTPAAEVGARAGRTAAAKWILVGAIAGSSVTGALLMGRRPSADERPAVERVAPREAIQPAGQLDPVSPVLERPALTETPRPAKHHLAQTGGPAHRAAAPSLAEQVSRIDTARVAIVSGDYDEATRLVARYHDDFPDGALAPDADVVALEAAAAKHDRAEVARRAASFLARYPHDPHTAQVEWLAEHPH